jgi:hypothetical protein
VYADPKNDLVLTSSEMKDFLTCRRGWWLAYYRKLRRRNEYSSLPNVGNLVHDGLQNWYEGKLDRPSDFVAAKTVVMQREQPELLADYAKDAELATIMLDGYIEWVAESGEDAAMEFVAAEQVVEVPVGPFRLRGKIDARFRRRYDGALIQLEHKTCGNLSDHPVWAQQNPQFLTYSMLAMMTKPEGVRTEGITVNMLRRVKRTPRAKPPFYGRHAVHHSVEELRSHYQHVVGIGHMIDQARQMLDEGMSHHLVCPPKFDRNHSWSCRCVGLDTLPDDGDRLEEYLADYYEPYNPNERYDETETV